MDGAAQKLVRCSPFIQTLSTMMRKSWCTLVAWLLPLLAFLQPAVFVTSTGEVLFKSEAPQELIRATSKELKGAIDGNGNSFSFKIRIASFDGFNSAMQRTHFNENYLQSEKFPEASFKGKIIEDINWNQPGKYQLRAKGQLLIHGVEQERIIKADVSILPDRSMRIECVFTVLLSEHQIPIPRIVKEKLADEIKVSIKATLLWRGA